MKRIIVVLLIAASAIASPALAHEHRDVGRWSTDVGWVEEPAFVGLKNGVHFGITALGGGHDHADEGDEGIPVTNAKLTVAVIFGDRDGTPRTDPIPLVPVVGEPGVYRTSLIPTRVGTYTFHVVGTVGSRKFDQYYTSGEKTFASVESSTDLEFPERDPSRQELAARMTTTDATIAAIDTGTPKMLAIIALVLAGLALVISIAAKKAR